MRLEDAIRRKSVPLRRVRDLKPLIDQVAGARVVMLGESSHGTHEFYEWRRMISEWLIVKHGFAFIAVEGDWPPARGLDAFVRGRSSESAPEALRRFDRWPTWMWANAEVQRLAEWMRTHNASVPEGEQAGFYGLDVYSFFESIDAVLARLERINPFLARRARARYGCLDPFGRDEKAYVRSLLEFPEGCEREVLENLEDLLKLRLDGMRERDEDLFDARQNARIAANAERYYRAMVHGSADSWNIRDRHMTETLGLLLDRFGPRSKGIVWAHNTHIGDYRATPMAAEGRVNIGGLAREAWGEDQVALVGFGTYEGEVVASRAWDGPVEKTEVPPGRPGSIEACFHAAAASLGSNELLLTGLNEPAARDGALAEVAGHRAIGVVYRPAYERLGNYVPTSLSRRYDAFVFIDRTTALEALPQGFDRRDIPETWPGGQ